MKTARRIGSGSVIAAAAAIVLLGAFSAAAEERSRTGTAIDVVDAPKSGARVLFRLAPADKAAVSGRKDKWVKVKSGGKEGWVTEEAWKSRDAAARAPAATEDKPASRAGAPVPVPVKPAADVAPADAKGEKPASRSGAKEADAKPDAAAGKSRAPEKGEGAEKDRAPDAAEDKAEKAGGASRASGASEPAETASEKRLKPGRGATEPAPPPPAAAAAPRSKGSLTPPPVPKDNPMTAAVFSLADKLAMRFFDQAAGSPFRRMAVMDFDAVGETVEQKKLNDVSRELITSRLSRYREFTLIERAKLAEIRKELDMSKGGAIDPSTAQQIGRLFGAQAVVVGAVTEAGAQYTVNARMVSVETGEVLIADDMQVEREGLIALSSKAIIKKTFAGMMIRSAILPGWGQIENDSPLKGYLFLGPAATALAGAAAMGVMWGRAAEDFNRMGTNYKNAATLDEAEQRFGEWTAAKDKVDTYKAATIGVAAAYAVIWGLNMADMALTGRDIERIDLDKIGIGKKDEQKASLNIGPAGASLAVKF